MKKQEDLTHVHLVRVLAQAVAVLLLAHALDVQVHRGVPRRVGRGLA